MSLDGEIRSNPNLRGRAAYAASLAAQPTYHDGTPRKTWEQLGEVEQWSWSRTFTPSPPMELVGSQIEEEDRREQKLATIVAPDNGTPDEVLFAVLECATAWVPEARIIGNVRAGDIVRAVRAARAAMGRVGRASATEGSDNG